MGKIVLFLILALVVYLVLRGVARARRPTASGDRPAESMVACAQCGVNLPRSEALVAAGRLYCSEEHRRLGPG